jgi:putative ATP-dependent endonuclease of OLD family
MLLEYFERRMKNAKTAGQLFLFEEPEAHLHPQLQRTLLQTLLDKGFQTILTTHSTHISSKSPIDSYVVLTDIGKRGIFSTNIVPSVGLLDKEQSDLERYLDATKSTLLYAKKVILVEGPAELFIIPLLVKQVLGKDLDRCGISVIPIYGIHFQVYAKLFGSNGLPKKCAIIADGDLKPSDADKITDDEDFDESTIVPVNLKELENDYVKIFDCKTTFEQALTIPGTLPMLLKGVQELGATRISRQIKDAIDTLQKGVEGEVRKKLFLKLREKILNTSKHYGKARFAQTISKYTNLATGIPSYIQDAIDWLIAK